MKAIQQNHIRSIHHRVKSNHNFPASLRLYTVVAAMNFIVRTLMSSAKFPYSK